MSDIRATTEGPERFEHHLTAAGDLLKQDKVEEAKTELAAALALKGDDIKALGLFGLACFRLSSFEEALPVYKKLVELKPTDASYRLNLGLGSTVAILIFFCVMLIAFIFFRFLGASPERR